MFLSIYKIAGSVVLAMIAGAALALATDLCHYTFLSPHRGHASRSPDGNADIAGAKSVAEARLITAQREIATLKEKINGQGMGVNDSSTTVAASIAFSSLQQTRVLNADGCTFVQSEIDTTYADIRDVNRTLYANPPQEIVVRQTARNVELQQRLRGLIERLGGCKP